MAKEKQYRKGKLRRLAEYVARLVEHNPAMGENPSYLHATLCSNVPGYGDPKKCFNCGQTMELPEDTHIVEVEVEEPWWVKQS